MRALEVCAGVGGLALGLHRVGIEHAAMVELGEYPRSVLRRHWPDVPLHEDMTTLRGTDVGPVDLVVGGIPCQPVSVAGLGKGVDDPRWLWPHFLRLILDTGAGYGLIENVRGLLSANSGEAFGVILREAVAAGFSVEWQVIAAGTLGAPHRRRRVFIILRRDGRWAWPDRAQVGLFAARNQHTPDSWPTSGRCDRRGWWETPRVWPCPAEGRWPWLLGGGGEMLPTPMVTDARNSRNESAIRSNPDHGRHSGKTLLDWADPTNGGRLPREMLPTPNASLQNYDEDPARWEARRARVKERIGNGNGVGLPLGQWAQRRGMLPTPAAHDCKGCHKPGQRRGQLGEAVEEWRGGYLSPEPVEWMMGYPPGWTLADGESLADAGLQAWEDWPDMPWTTTDSPPYRRPRLMGCGNGVVAQVGQDVASWLLGSL